jgi:hypothetical protein
MREVCFQSEAMGATLRGAGEGREETVTVVLQAFSSCKTDTVVDLGSHHVCLYLQSALTT